MRPHATRLDRLEAEHGMERYARMSYKELTARLDFLFARASIDNTREARAACVAQLRLEHGQGSRT